MNAIRIGTRSSTLAVIQAQLVADHLIARGQEAQLVRLTTTGDRILDRTLDKVGGKGLLVRELDAALLEGRTDLSVHSLKDVPMVLPEQLPLLGFSRREDPRDALILPEGVTELDFSKPIGCSSSRRILQLKQLFPRANFVPIRGNVQTRLRKLDEGGFCATILAVAGLKRLGLENRISRIFETDELIPAAGQGVLAIQGRSGENYPALADFLDENSRVISLCERAFVRSLDGGCTTPTAAYAEFLQDGSLRLTGLYQDERTGMVARLCSAGDRREPEALGIYLAEEIRKAVRQDGSGK